MARAKLFELLDALEQELRADERGGSKRNVPSSTELATLGVRGLRQLVEGEREQAALAFEALLEELHECTLTLPGE